MAEHRLITELMQSGEIIYTTSGVSMYPMLRNRCDVVHIKKCDRPLKRYDLPLYVRGNALVLHRILKVKNDHYIICGDNCINIENIPLENVYGYVDEFWRGKRHYKSTDLRYRIYVHIWCDFFYIRRAILILKLKAKNAAKKLGTK